MKAIVSLIAMILIISSCGSKSSDDEPVAAAPTWTDVSAALTAGGCVSCHTGSTNVSVLQIDFTASEAKFKEAQASSKTAYTPAAQVSAGSMPKQGSGYSLTAAQKSAIINFK